MEEIALIHFRHPVNTAIDICLYTIHGTKIQIILFLPKKNCNFVAKIMVRL
jgi:hypothetical protein